MKLSINCREEIEKAANEIFADTGYKVVIDEELSVGRASISDPVIQDKMVKVGVNGLGNDFKHFVRALVNIHHEKGHYDQYQEMKNGTDNVAVTLGYLCKQGSPYWYDMYYSKLPYEIDAEWRGIKGAYDYISNHYPKLDASKCIVEYIDEQINVHKDVRYTNLDLPKLKANKSTIDVIETACKNRIKKESTECISMPSFSDAVKLKGEDDDRMFKILKDPKVKEIIRLLDNGTPQYKFLAARQLNEDTLLLNDIGNAEVNSPDYFTYIRSYEFLKHAQQLDNSIEGCFAEKLFKQAMLMDGKELAVMRTNLVEGVKNHEVYGFDRLSAMLPPLPDEKKDEAQSEDESAEKKIKPKKAVKPNKEPRGFFGFGFGKSNSKESKNTEIEL